MSDMKRDTEGRAIMTKGEPHICGRRLDNFGMGMLREGEESDNWETGRWANRDDILRDMRSCSYCSGIHPEDALTLLRAGWDIDATTKGYKRYIEPPGTRAYSNELVTKGFNRGLVTLPVPASGAVPPVKSYSQHMTQQQILEWNKIVDQRREAKSLD